MGKNGKWTLAAGAVALTLGTPALATPLSIEESNRADAQCLAMTIMTTGVENVESMDQDTLAGTMLIMGYYIGRIEMRSPDVDFGALTKDVVENDFTDEETTSAISERCLSEIKGLTDRIEGATGNF